MTRIVSAVVLLLSSLGGGCTTASAPDEPARVAQYLPRGRHLQRLSMALRGVRPDVGDLERVEREPAALDEIVDRYLDSAEFGATMRDLHDRALQVRTDLQVFPAGFPAIGVLANEHLTRINRSVQEAPLRLIEHVIRNDRPYSEIVTADYMLADRYVAAVWGVKRNPAAKGWQKTRWSDDRPAAGILASSWLFSRHATTISNANRGRANAVSRMLLCYDFAARSIPLDASVNFADPAAVADAVRSNSACASCHQVLDPLASYFANFSPLYVPAALQSYPHRSYYPRGKPPWVGGPYGMTRRAASFFGVEASSLDELGRLIAEDPRFSLCAARRFYAFFQQIPVDRVPRKTASRLQQLFVESGFDAKALVRAIVLSDDFRRADAVERDGGTELPGMKKASPEQLARLIEDLTGFRWRTDLALRISESVVGTVDLATDSLFGFKVLAGGTDGYYVTQPALLYNATASLFLRGLAREAAHHVVAVELGEGSRAKRRLFDRIDADEREPKRVRAQLSSLYRRLFGERLATDAEAIDFSLALFEKALARNNDVRNAWRVVLTAMLQDLRIAYY